MAVRIEPSLPTKFSSTVEKPDEITKTALDHVRRILIDHDYLKHPFPDELSKEKTAIVQPRVAPHVDQKNVESGFQDHSKACSSRDSKVESAGELPNEGIQAYDLSSLLDKFEQAINNSPSILTPATSPGCPENWNEPLSLKINNTHVNSTDLTPPTTPPVRELSEEKTAQNGCKTSEQQKKAKLLAQKNTEKKVKDLKHKVESHEKTKTAPVISKKNERNIVKVESTILEKHTKDENHLARNEQILNNGNKRKSNDTVEETVSPSKKTKIYLENKNENKDNKMSNNCQESKIALPKTKSVVYEHCGKILEDEKKTDKPNNEVKELSSTKNSSNVSDVTEEKSPKLISNKEKPDKVHSNNNIDVKEKDNTCLAVNNNDEVKIAHDKVHLNDSHKHDSHRSKSRHIEENTKRKAEQYNDGNKHGRRKRKHSSRSTDEESSDEERSNYRRSERHRESTKYSCDSERRKEKYRKYSSRDDYDRKYDEERRRHRKHDDGHNYHGNQWKNMRDIEHERKIDFRLGRSGIKDVAKGERRVIYVGGLAYGATQDELWNRFRKFGPIEKVTVHLRVGERDNYGFVTFFEPEDARDCIEHGNSDSTEPHLDLCFGGRRQFCGGSYVDFDSTNSHIEELHETYGKVCDEVPEEDDFDSLLRMCQEGLGR